MSRKYLERDLSKVPAEDLGRTVGPRRLCEILIQNGVQGDAAKQKVIATAKLVREFLKFARDSGRSVSKDVIFELLVDCLRDSFPLSNNEKWARRKMKAANPRYEVTRRNVSPADVCYRNELLWTVMHVSKSHEASCDQPEQWLGIVEASELVAKWLICLGIDLGSRKGSANYPTKSEARHGPKVASAAAAIRRSYRRWTPLQAPNRPLGELISRR